MTSPSDLDEKEYTCARTEECEQFLRGCDQGPWCSGFVDADAPPPKPRNPVTKSLGLAMAMIAAAVPEAFSMMPRLSGPRHRPTAANKERNRAKNAAAQKAAKRRRR